MVEKQKAKVMAIKQHRTRGGINLSNEEEDKSDIRDNINPDQVDDIYSLPL